MATFVFFDAFKEALPEKKHDLGADTLAVALTNSAPDAALNSVLADITEISYANLSSRTLTTTSSGQSAGAYALVLQDLTLTASGAVGPFRYAVLYNDTPVTKDLIGYADYGSSISLADGETLDLDLAALGAITLT